MTSRLVSLTFDANDPLRLARSWAEALRWDVDEDGDEVWLVPTDGTPFGILFEPVPEEKVGKNLIHLDLTTGCTSTSRPRPMAISAPRSIDSEHWGRRRSTSGRAT